MFAVLLWIWLDLCIANQAKISYHTATYCQDLKLTSYILAIVAKNHNPIFSKPVQKLASKGKPAKVIIVTIMRKFLHITFGVIKHNSAFNPNFTIDF